jgi:uncharacterized protein YlxP (DUF503 family)
MVIGALEVNLLIGGSQSLKDKRRVLRSLKDRIRRTFNVAVAEVEDHDKWQSGVLGVVTVSNDKAHANEVLSKVVNFVEEDGEARLENFRMTFF